MNDYKFVKNFILPGNKTIGKIQPIVLEKNTLNNTSMVKNVLEHVSNDIEGKLKFNQSEFLH